jgi:hypothetical protein
MWTLRVLLHARCCTSDASKNPERHVVPELLVSRFTGTQFDKESKEGLVDPDTFTWSSRLSMSTHALFKQNPFSTHPGAPDLNLGMRLAEGDIHV